MTCPHLPGVTGFLLRPLVLAGSALVLLLSLPPAAEAAPQKSHTATSAKTNKPAKTGAKQSKASKPSKAKSTKASAASNTKKVGSRKAAAPACPKPTAKTKAVKGRKRQPTPVCKTGTARATGAPAATTGTAATAAAAAPAAAQMNEPPGHGIRLPLMLRTTPSLPDSPAALQARLDSIVAAQGASTSDVQVSGVRQLAPDIYAFSLQCADAEQCQRLRLAIEKERDWVAGLQLDERRNIPRPPERSSPAAR